MRDPELSKEAVRHAQRDMRNIRDGPSIDQIVMAHAQKDMAALLPEPPPKKEPNWFQKAQAGQPKLGAQLAAMFREGINDIRQHMNEIFFGNHEHAPEAGTPGNPTQIMTTDELRPDDFDHNPTRGHSRER